MEAVILGIFILSVSVSLFAVWKYFRLKKDIYDYTQDLEDAIDRMYKGEELRSLPYKKDDLWGKMYEKLARLSYLYTHKNLEISKEKEALKELVSDISHQTKTPLANIKLFLETMAEEPCSGREQEYIKKLSVQTDKLDFLLQSMVKLSRLETGTIQIKKEVFPLWDTLAAALGNAVILAEKKHISINVQCEEDLLLNHDKKWTGEALFNLLDNGVKYTAPGGHIYVEVKRQELFTSIRIRDTGKGIPPERQGTIFTRFYREPEVHHIEGIGVGLYLARKIITMQNGYIEVHSREGRGSTFTVCLPNND